MFWLLYVLSDTVNQCHTDQVGKGCCGTDITLSKTRNSPTFVFLRELKEIEAESIGWQPLEPGVYLHVSDATEVLAGVPQAGAAV